MQFHPESILTQNGKQLLKNFLEMADSSTLVPVQPQRHLPHVTLATLREALSHAPDNTALLLLYGHACIDELLLDEAQEVFDPRS